MYILFGIRANSIDGSWEILKCFADRVHLSDYIQSIRDYNRELNDPSQWNFSSERYNTIWLNRITQVCVIFFNGELTSFDVDLED